MYNDHGFDVYSIEEFFDSYLPWTSEEMFDPLIEDVLKNSGLNEQSRRYYEYIRNHRQFLIQDPTEAHDIEEVFFEAFNRINSR